MANLGCGDTEASFTQGREEAKMKWKELKLCLGAAG